MERESLFPRNIFTYPLAFISATAFIVAIHVVVLVALISYGNSHSDRAFTAIGSHIIIALWLYLTTFTILRSRMADKWKVLTAVCSAILTGGPVVYLTILLQNSVLDEPIHPIESFKFLSTGSVYVITALFLFLQCTVIVIWIRNRQKTQKINALVIENLRNRYLALKQQLSPHFLFNSLNTLRGLIGNDDERAIDYVDNLADMFRYTLQEKSVVTLRDELDFLSAYSALLLVRFGSALHIEIDCGSEYDDWYIPPMSLQTLVENATKHNVISDTTPLHITISMAEGEFVRVSNGRMPKTDPVKSNGTGLLNLSERALLLTGRDISINRTDETFTVDVPLVSPLKK